MMEKSQINMDVNTIYSIGWTKATKCYLTVSQLTKNCPYKICQMNYQDFRYIYVEFSEFCF